VRIALVAIPLLMLVAWLTLLRPTALGGPVQYVVIEGNSMEPTLSSGDLVLVRKQDEYEVGDVISYRAPIGPVMHRIVDGNAHDGYVPQGDNNSIADPWRPNTSEIIGKAWVTLPGGARLRWLGPLSVSASGMLFAGLGVRLLMRSRERAPARI
jgi:signal peptidase